MWPLAGRQSARLESCTCISCLFRCAALLCAGLHRVELTVVGLFRLSLRPTPIAKPAAMIKAAEGSTEETGMEANGHSDAPQIRRRKHRRRSVDSNGNRKDQSVSQSVNHSWPD